MSARRILAIVSALTGPVGLAAGQNCQGPKFAFTRASSPGFLRLLDEGTILNCGEVTTGVLPAGVKIGPNGNMFVWGQNSGPLNEYDRNTGALVRTVVTAGAGGSLQGRDIEFMPGGDILVAGGSSSRVARFRGSDGAYLGDFVLAGAGGLTAAFGMGYGPSGALYVASANTHQILEFNGTTGAFQRVAVQAGAGGLDSPYDVAFGPDGTIYATSVNLGAVHRFDGETGAPLGQFNQVLVPPCRGLAFGPNGNLFVCAWGGPLGGGVYEFDGQTGGLVRLAAPGAGAIFLSFECALEFSQQPSPRSVAVNQPTSFSVTVQGSGPWSYQWRKDGQPLLDGGRIAGSQTSTLAINPTVLGDAGVYDVVVRNGCKSITSLPAALAVVCYPNCDQSTTAPILNVNDFVCFQTRYAVGDPYANCDGSTTLPILNVNDFTCFINTYAAGCP